MFDIGWSELLVIGVVALIAIGPKELPGVLRAIGHWMGKIRRMASEFQGQFQEAMREAEMADLKKQVDDMTSAATDFTNYDPLRDVREEIDKVNEDVSRALDEKSYDAVAESSVPAPAPAGTADAPQPEPAVAIPDAAPPQAAKPAGEGS
jgi:sec-independent protein translocase protein TatB